MADFFNLVDAFFRSSAQQLPTNGFDGTMAIGLSFIFLAYIWHPIVGWAYHRMRAYRAWRAIEQRQAVEVTAYPTTTEVFGRQGMCAWDAARIIIVALGAFNLASWGLELTMDLYALENSAWLLTQPPPVYETNSAWIVSAFVFVVVSVVRKYAQQVLHPPSKRPKHDNSFLRIDSFPLQHSDNAPFFLPLERSSDPHGCARSTTFLCGVR